MNILHTIKRRKPNWIGHILRRNCCTKHVIAGKRPERMKVTGRWERRRRQLMDDLKKKRRYRKLKEETLDRNVWRTRCGRGNGPVCLRLQNEWMNEWTGQEIKQASHKATADKPMARVPIIASGIQCCPNFFISFTEPASLYCEEYVYIGLHMYDCAESVYELPLLQNNTASGTFLHKSGAMRNVDRIFIAGVSAWRWLGEHVTLDRTFYSLPLKQEVVAAPQLRPHFLPCRHSSRRPLLAI